MKIRILPLVAGKHAVFLAPCHCEEGVARRRPSTTLRPSPEPAEGRSNLLKRLLPLRFVWGRNDITDISAKLSDFPTSIKFLPNSHGILLIFFFLFSVSRFSLGFAYAQEQKELSSQQETQDEEKEDSHGEQKKKKQAQEEEEIKKKLTASAPVVEIKRLESEKPLYSIELRNVELSDLFRVIAHDYNLNILVEQDVQGVITASFTNISLDEAIEGIAEMGNLKIEKKGNILRISPNLITKTIILRHIEAKKLLESAKSLVAAQPQAPVTQAAAAAQTAPATQATAPAPASTSSQAATSTTIAKRESTIYDFLSNKGKILLGQQPNSIIVIDYPPNVEKVENYLKAVDQKMSSQVFKLNYLKASEIVGGESKAASGTATTSTATTSSSGTTSSTSH